MASLCSLPDERLLSRLTVPPTPEVGRVAYLGHTSPLDEMLIPVSGLSIVPASAGPGRTPVGRARQLA
jgi:hypothetical protein